MSKAIRCDRCKGYFVPAEEKKLSARFKEITYVSAETIRDSRYEKIDENLDLCPGCTADFELFMDGYPLEIHENDFDQNNLRYPANCFRPDPKKWQLKPDPTEEGVWWRTERNPNKDKTTDISKEDPTMESYLNAMDMAVKVGNAKLEE